MSHNGSFHFTGFPGYNLNDSAVDNSGMPNEPPNGFNPGYNLPNNQHAGPSHPSSRWFLPPHEVGRRSHPYMRPVAVPGGLGDLSHLRNPTTAPTTLYPGNNGMLCSPPLKVSSETHLSAEGYNTMFYPAMVVPQPVTIPSPIPPPTFTPAPPCDRKSPLLIIDQTSVTHPIGSAYFPSTPLAGVTTGGQDRDALCPAGPSNEGSGCK